MKDGRAKNIHGVRQRQWGKWTLIARHVFNKTMTTLNDNQEVMKHPDAPVLPDEVWRTYAWNSAFTAASIADRGVRHLLDVTIKEIKGYDPKELRPR